MAIWASPARWARMCRPERYRRRGVTVQDVAAATGCQTLSSRVKPGQVYRVGGGAWQTKGAGAISLPAYCATAGQ